MTLIYIMSATIIVSAISLIGIATLSLKKDILNNILLLLVGFAAGGLIGNAFLELLPEALEKGSENVFLYVILGFTIFFIFERYFHWVHCHDGECDIHTFAYLNLLGDGVHNFMDGVIIAVSFTVGKDFGIVTTLAIVLHEIPQEIGDFGLLVYGGFTRARALFYNFLCSLTAVFGGLLGYFLSETISNISSFLIPIVAGGFIYIAASDLIPELHKEANHKKANLSIIAFVLGVLLMVLARHSH